VPPRTPPDWRTVKHLVGHDFSQANEEIEAVGKKQWNNYWAIDAAGERRAYNRGYC
jgi:hypothetical protein